jgi:hypothetical protein
MKPLFRISKSLFFLFLLLTAACSKDDKTITRERAEAVLSQTQYGDIMTRKNDDPVYAYSDIALNISSFLKNVMSTENVYSYWTYDSVTVIMDNKKVKITYELGDKNLIIRPVDLFYAASGSLTVQLHASRYYSPIPNGPPTENEAWLFLCTEVVSVEYAVANCIGARTQNVFVAPSPGVLQTSVFFVPSVKTRVAPGEIVDGQFKYEITSILSVGNATIPLTVDQANDSLTYLQYEGALDAQKTYTLLVTATWLRKVADQWLACDARLNESVSQQLNTTGESALLQPFGADDLEFTYPLDRQVNFLPKEYDHGYFRLSNRETMKQYGFGNLKIQFVDVKTNTASIPKQIYFDRELNILQYGLPQGYFEAKRVYKAIISNEDNATVYSYYFGTSKFDTFIEKWAVLKTCFGWMARIPEDDFFGSGRTWRQIINCSGTTEVFPDYYEFVTDDMRQEALIQFETHIDASWKTTYHWLIYDQPSLSFNRQSHPKYKKYGFPPIRAIYFETSTTYTIKLSDDNCSTGNVTLSSPWRGMLNWVVQNWMTVDAYTARANAIKIPAEQRTEWQQTAVDGYPDLTPLPYLDFALGDDILPPMDVFYILPGVNLETTTIKDVQFSKAGTID